MRVPAVYPAKERTIRKLIEGRGGRGTKKYIELGNLNEKSKKKTRQKTLKNTYALAFQKFIQGKC